MSITVRFGFGADTLDCVLDRGHWTCPDTVIEKMLNHMIRGGPGERESAEGYHGDLDYVAAKAAIRAFRNMNGRIVKRDVPEWDPNEIY